MNRRPPSYYEDIAQDAERRGDWKRAIAAWNSAAAASIGHNRSQRYCNRAFALAREHGLLSGTYLDDIDRGKDHIVWNLMLLADQIETEWATARIVGRPFPDMSIADDVRHQIEEELAAGCYGDPMPHHSLGTPDMMEGG